MSRVDCGSSAQPSCSTTASSAETMYEPHAASSSVAPSERASSSIPGAFAASMARRSVRSAASSTGVTPRKCAQRAVSTTDDGAISDAAAARFACPSAASIHATSERTHDESHSGSEISPEALSRHPPTPSSSVASTGECAASTCASHHIVSSQTTRRTRSGRTCSGRDASARLSTWLRRSWLSQPALEASSNGSASLVASDSVATTRARTRPAPGEAVSLVEPLLEAVVVGGGLQSATAVHRDTARALDGILSLRQTRTTMLSSDCMWLASALR